MALAKMTSAAKCKLSVLLARPFGVSAVRMAQAPPPQREEDIVKSVFISQSHDIYTNLALEDWLYRHSDFTKHHVMLLWRNDPCVVVGRHQNPWLEANTDVLSQRGIALARRNSGGGTVYHDQGNLNATFFVPRERYNRKNNLLILAKTLHREWKLNAEINKREDMILESTYKISGTASKLGRPNSYHHCTLLVDVNKDCLSAALSTTGSVASPTVNLSEVNSSVEMERLMTVLGWEFLRTTPITQRDAGWDLVSKQRGFQMINPTDEWFPGLGQIKEELESWDWQYGKTPKFTVRKSIRVDTATDLILSVEVDKGVMGDASLKLPTGLTWGAEVEHTDHVKLVSSVVGRRYSEDSMALLEQSVKRQAPGLLHAARAAAVSA